MSELVDKQVNVQKESLKKLPGFTQNSRKPMKKCAMKMKETNKEKKNDGRLKYFCSLRIDVLPSKNQTLRKLNHC